MLFNILVSVSYITDTSEYNLMGFAADRSDFPSMTDEEIKTALTHKYTTRFEVEQGHTVRRIDIAFFD